MITLEFQRQRAKELQEYFKQKKLDEADQGPFFGFIGKNEISNGRSISFPSFSTLILLWLLKFEGDIFSFVLAGCYDISAAI